MDVYKTKVRSALEELSDVDYQRRVWTGKDPRGEVASFEECVAELYDDSALILALEKGQVVFSPEIDQRLRSLGELLAEVETNRHPLALVEDPAMERVRRTAAQVLRDLDA
jgi:hypothetical protein